MGSTGNRKFEAVIFDAEGVVIDTERLWDKSQEMLLKRRGLKYDRHYLKPRMAGQTLLQGARLMINYYGLHESPHAIAEERKATIELLFEKDIRFIDGFLPFHKAVKNASYKHSIATAMSKSLMVKVERKLLLKSYFNEHIYFIEDVGNRSKPEPDVFLLAAERMGVEPGMCLVIEDAPHGIEAAYRAGMTSVALTTTFGQPELTHADLIAENFEVIWTFMQNGSISL